MSRAPEGTQGWVRIVIEKPFGRDLASSRALNQVVASAWTEDQVYRIDHYLGKETVQNVLVFRWANGIFEPLWNRNHVDHVQITVGESIGIERIDASASKKLFDALDERVAAGVTHLYYEDVYSELIGQGQLVAEVADVSGLRWTEVDTFEDLETARRLFG